MWVFECPDLLLEPIHLRLAAAVFRQAGGAVGVRVHHAAILGLKGFLKPPNCNRSGTKIAKKIFAYLKIPEVELLALRRLLLIKETKSSLKFSIFENDIRPPHLPPLHCHVRPEAPVESP